MPSHIAHERFYALIARLRELPGQGKSLGECEARDVWPRRGVYFFTEPGEYRGNSADSPRVVRVGTHAVSTGSRATLWSRLRAHRGTGAGGGNHRGSIFRLHLGHAIAKRDALSVSSWGNKSTASRATREAEAPHEHRVSEYLARMSVMWVSVDDDPGPQSARAVIERGAIALLSNRLSPVDPPSDNWLGRTSSRPEIQRSGLWNLNYVSDDVQLGFLDLLSDAVERMEAVSDR
jgi:hypothetical protein